MIIKLILMFLKEEQREVKKDNKMYNVAVNNKTLFFANIFIFLSSFQLSFCDMNY